MRTTLTISTILGDQQVSGDKGPLLLSAVQGMEGISMPYAYDVTMFREIEDGDIDPAKMIGTRATIGMRAKTDNFTFRRGIFQTFDKAGTNELNFERGLQTRLPGVQGSHRPRLETVGFRKPLSRVREHDGLRDHDRDHARLPRHPERLSRLQHLHVVRVSWRRWMSFKKIPYCVQYGESSLSFLHRLMSQFGIWYAFDHDHLADDDTKQEMMLLGNSVAKFRRLRLLRDGHRLRCPRCEGDHRFPTQLPAAAQARLGQRLRHGQPDRRATWQTGCQVNLRHDARARRIRLRSCARASRP